MRVALPGQSRMVRKVLPRTLLGRSLLIILVPLVITLAVALQIFYGIHLNIVSRRFASAVAGEVGQTVDMLDHYPAMGDRLWTLRQAWEQFDFNARIEPGAKLPDAVARLTRPFIAAYWSWAGTIQTLQDTRFYDLIIKITKTELASVPACYGLLLAQIALGLGIAYLGCRRSVWD